MLRRLNVVVEFLVGEEQRPVVVPLAPLQGRGHVTQVDVQQEEADSEAEERVGGRDGWQRRGSRQRSHQGLREVPEVRHRIQDAERDPPDDVTRVDMDPPGQVPHEAPRPEPILLDHGHQHPQDGHPVEEVAVSRRRLSTCRAQVVPPMGRVQVHPADAQGGRGASVRQCPHGRVQVQVPPHLREHNGRGGHQDLVPLLRHEHRARLAFLRGRAGRVHRVGAADGERGAARAGAVHVDGGEGRHALRSQKDEELLHVGRRSARRVLQQRGVRDRVERVFSTAIPGITSLCIDEVRCPVTVDRHFEFGTP